MRTHYLILRVCVQIRVCAGVCVCVIFTYRPCEVEGKHDGIAESLDVKVGNIQ